MKLTNFYQFFYTPNKLNPKYKKVDEYLIRGPHPNISDLIELKREGVTQIYDFRHIGIRGFKFIEKFICKELGIKYIRCPYSHLKHQFPTTDELNTIAKSVKTNGENGGKTLFHCNSGSHRTAHMTAFYDLTKGEPIDEVFNKLGVIKYSKRVQKVVQKHFYEQKYFNREYKNTHTLNPIKKFKNKFNNKIIDAISTAQASFLSIITRYKNW